MKRYFKPIEKNGNSVPSTSQTVETQLSSVATPSEEKLDSSDSDGIVTVSKKKTYAQKYKPAWENRFCWLKNKNGLAYCKLCKNTMVNNLAHIKRHDADSRKHRENIKEAKEMQKLDVSFLGQQTLKKKQVEMMCVMYCIQHCLPFRLMDSLPKLIQTISPQSIPAQQIKCSRTKSTEYVNTIIGPFAAEKISKILRSQYFSIIIDETTDLTCDKCLALICRYFDESLGKVNDIFFGMIKLESSKASDIFTAIMDQFYKFQIDLQNIIGLATDNASVMAGNLQGVKAKFQGIKSDIFFLGCTCHSISLCINHALKHFPDLIEKNIKNIYNHFSHSPKRLNNFSTFQKDFNLQNHKILRLCKIRWLSLESVVNRILEQWEALKQYFILYCFEIKDNKDSNAHEISNFLNNNEFKMYLVFLSFILDKLNRANKIFQSEKPEIQNLYLTMKGIFLEILKNFIILNKIDVDVDVKNITNHLPIKSMFFSLAFQEIEESFLDKDPTKILTVKHHLIDFYVEICYQIQKRFELKDSRLKLLKYCNVAEIISGSMPSIRPLLINYPFKNKEVSIETLNDQWRSLIGNNELLSKLNSCEDSVNNWIKIKNIKNSLEDPMYLELSSYMLTLLSLPHSSAAAERAFSNLNLIKNKKTNRLENKTIENIMFSRNLLKDNSSDNDDIYVPEEELCKFATKFKFKDGIFESI